MAIMVTGSAGFIGAHVTSALLARGETVIGIDNLNAYYDPVLKRDRLRALVKTDAFVPIEGDIAEPAVMTAILDKHPIDRVVHLAAQAGVRHSIDHPEHYTHSNLAGHAAVLEFARRAGVSHLVYASSSSVYGANSSIPFSEADQTDNPVSFYGATKKACEIMSASYAHLYDLPQTGLRLFTVYGPWGRPDMAYMIFARKIIAGEPIDVFGEGDMGRDFTFIDDTVAGIIAALDRPPAPPATGGRPHRVFNLGNDRPESLGDLIGHLEALLGRKADRKLRPMQPGDVRRTWADITLARKQLGYAPKTSLRDGLERFVDWYRKYYHA